MMVGGYRYISKDGVCWKPVPKRVSRRQSKCGLFLIIDVYKGIAFLRNSEGGIDRYGSRHTAKLCPMVPSGGVAINDLPMNTNVSFASEKSVLHFASPCLIFEWPRLFTNDANFSGRKRVIRNNHASTEVGKWNSVSFLDFLLIDGRGISEVDDRIFRIGADDDPPMHRLAGVLPTLVRVMGTMTFLSMNVSTFSGILIFSQGRWSICISSS
jgi:hypothetical protein